MNCLRCSGACEPVRLDSLGPQSSRPSTSRDMSASWAAAKARSYPKRKVRALATCRCQAVVKVVLGRAYPSPHDLPIRSAMRGTAAGLASRSEKLEHAPHTGWLTRLGASHESPQSTHTSARPVGDKRATVNAPPVRSASRNADDGVVGRARYGVGVGQPDALAICVATSPPVVARPIAAAPIAAPCAMAWE
jgi:hypothetical protein